MGSPTTATLLGHSDRGSTPLLPRVSDDWGCGRGPGTGVDPGSSWPVGGVLSSSLRGRGTGRGEERVTGAPVSDCRRGWRGVDASVGSSKGTWTTGADWEGSAGAPRTHSTDRRAGGCRRTTPTSWSHSTCEDPNGGVRGEVSGPRGARPGPHTTHRVGAGRESVGGCAHTSRCS